MEEKKRNLIIVACALIFLGFGGWYIRNRTIEIGQRFSTNSYGVPLLSGPLTPGGPTFGPGDRADVDTNFNGWVNVGPANAPDSQRGIAVGVTNKSKRVWHHVQAQVGLFDQQGKYISTEPGNFGDIKPGGSAQVTIGPVDAQVAMFRVLGYKGY